MSKLKKNESTKLHCQSNDMNGDTKINHNKLLILSFNKPIVFF